MVYVHVDMVGWDFVKGYFAAVNFLNNHSIYDMPGGNNPYYCFPPVTILFMPFSALSPVAAKMLWFAFCHVLIWLSIFVIYKYGSRNNRQVSLAAACAVVLFSMPLYGMVLTGNPVILIFFGLSLVYAGLIAGRKKYVPAWVAFFSAVKICPVVMIGVFARRRDYHSIVSYILVAAVMCVLSLAVFGMEDNLIYFQQLQSADRFSGVFSAISLTCFLKLFWPGVSGWPLLCINLVFLAVLIALWWRVSGTSNRGSGDRGSQVTDLFVLTVIMVLVFPSSWLMYWALLIMPFYFIVFSLLEGRRDFKFPWIFVLLLLCLNFWEIIHYHLPLSAGQLTARAVELDKSLHPVLFPLMVSMYFFATLALFAWILANYRELSINIERISLTANNRCRESFLV